MSPCGQNIAGVELDPNTKRPVNVNWQLLAHYSGSHSKIKGLLLQDLSNPTDALMQITSDDCRWGNRETARKATRTGWWFGTSILFGIIIPID